MQENSSPKEGGFTLLELLIATIVTVTGLVTIMTGVVQVNKLKRLDEELTIAFIACRESLDELRSTPFANLPSLDGQGFDVPAMDGSASGLTCVPEDPDNLAGRFTVVIDKTAGGSTLYMVTTTVTWVGVRGRQEVKLQTIVGERKTS